MPAQITNSIPALDLRSQYASIREEIRAAIQAVLDSQIFILGPQVQGLEQELAAYCGARHAVGVASGTDALLLALYACGVRPGDEVIVPAFTYIATADVVSLLGATPVFVDIEPSTFTLNPRKLEHLVTRRTRALIPVHLYGQTADMDPILEFARAHNLAVIEDAAQAIGATYRGKRAGSIGDIGCLSFYPTKNLGGYGDGGMILTNSPELQQKLLTLRVHGERRKYISTEQGWNSRLDEIQAAVLRVKLRHLDEWNRARRNRADEYRRTLEKVSGVVPPKVADWGEHVFHQYTVRVPRRDQVQRSLAEQGVASTVYYPVPLHLNRFTKTWGTVEEAILKPSALLPSASPCRFFRKSRSTRLDAWGKRWSARSSRTETLGGGRHLRLQGPCLGQAAHEVEDGFEAVEPENFIQPGFRFRQSCVVANAGFPVCREARLTGINFPGMEIHDHGLAVTRVDAMDRPACVPHRQQPQIAPARRREVVLPHFCGCHGDFANHPPRPKLTPVAETGCVGNSVPVMMNGEDARVVLEAFFGEDIECPQRLLHDRKRGRAEAQDLNPRSGLDGLLGLPQILTK